MAGRIARIRTAPARVGLGNDPLSLLQDERVLRDRFPLRCSLKTRQIRASLARPSSLSLTMAWGPPRRFCEVGTRHLRS